MERTFPDLRIERGPEGTWHLKQDVGPCDPTDEHWVILDPAHLDVLARAAGYVSSEELTRACDRERERLALLAAMVMVHTREGDPLRAAACLLHGETPNLVAPADQRSRGLQPVGKNRSEKADQSEKADYYQSAGCPSATCPPDVRGVSASDADRLREPSLSAGHGQLDLLAPRLAAPSQALEDDVGGAVLRPSPSPCCDSRAIDQKPNITTHISEPAPAGCRDR